MADASTNMTCFCGQTHDRLLFYAHEYRIGQCVACGQVRTIPLYGSTIKHSYDETDIKVYVEKEKEFRRLFREVIDFIQQFIRKGILVDIGAGIGLLVSEAQKAGFTAYGFEPSKASVRVARKKFEVALQAKEFDAKSIIRPVEVVVINHVLEHVEKPLELLRNVSSQLRKGGYLIIGVPNFGNIIAQLKKGRWQSLIPEQHRWHFTNWTLDYLVCPLGFMRVGCRSFNHDRSMHPWWKQPLYFIHDTITSLTCSGEAILVAYKKL